MVIFNLKLIYFYDCFSAKLRGKIVEKAPIRKSQNSKVCEKLFHFDVMDDTCLLRCTMFDNDVDKFYDKLKVTFLMY